MSHFHIEAFGDVVHTNHYDKKQSCEVGVELMQPVPLSSGKSHSQMNVG